MIIKQVGLVELFSVLYLITIKESSSHSGSIIHLHAVLYLFMSYVAVLCLRVIKKE